MANFSINIVSIFPEYFTSPLSSSLLGKAIERGLISVEVADPRDHAEDPRQVDDNPYGGGAGMVMAPGPIYGAVESLSDWQRGPVIGLTPSGARFDQRLAASLAGEEVITLICGRYEGIDQRVGDNLCTMELSIGDYVIAGGEAAALVVIEAVTRLIPGVLGNEASIADESFSQARIHKGASEAGGGADVGGAVSSQLEYPQYTRPENFRGMRVPEVLLSGDHGAIARWREEAANARTARMRPDILGPVVEPGSDQRLSDESA